MRDTKQQGKKGQKDRGLVKKINAAGKPVWYVRIRHEGQMRWFGSFTSKTKAREFYEEAKTDQRRGQFFPDRYQRVGKTKLKSVVDDHMATNGNRSVKDDQRYAEYWVKRLSNPCLSVITAADIDHAKNDLLKQGLANQTVVHYLKFLRHVLNVAIRDGKLDHNPVVQVEFPKLHKGRLRFLSVDEEAALCREVGSRYAPWIRFAILTGLRRMEQFALRWSDVDLEQGLMTLPRTKGGGVQYVRLSHEANVLLRSMETWLISVWVFPNQNPARHMDPQNFYHRVYMPAVKAVGLKDVTWHTLRHTFASRLAMAGATDAGIATCLRHSSTSLVRRYAAKFNLTIKRLYRRC